MTTTIDAVCRKMIDVVELLIPSTLATYRFVHWTGHERPLRTQAREGSPDMVRRFSVVPLGDVSGPAVTNLDQEWVEETVEVVVAYPRKAASRWGTEPELALFAAIAADRTQLEGAIGPAGYQELDLSLGGDAVVLGGPEWPQRTREDEEQVVFSVMRMRVLYSRSI